MNSKRVYKLRENKETTSYIEMAKTLDGKDIHQMINYLLTNLNGIRVDERLFSFIFRKFRPFVYQILHATERQRPTLDMKIFKAFSRVLQVANLTYERFLEYFPEQDITAVVEAMAEAPEKHKEPLLLFLETVKEKYTETLPLFKGIIANQLLNLQDVHKSQIDLAFCFKTLHYISVTGSFGDDTVEYYVQYILPRILDLSVADLEPSSKLASTICSAAPECQRTTLRYFTKIFPCIDSLQQVKLLELTAVILRLNLFYRATKSLDWEFGDIINMALRSESYLVVDAVIEVFVDPAIKRYIFDVRSTFIPRIFDNLYRLSKRFWRPEQKFKTIQAIGAILKIDVEIFEQCLISYNRKRFYRGSQDPSLNDESYYINKIRKLEHRLN